MRAGRGTAVVRFQAFTLGLRLRKACYEATNESDPPGAEERLVALLLEDAHPTMLETFIGVVLWT